jgi:hypothetical protein
MRISLEGMRYSVLDVKHISLLAFSVVLPALAQDAPKWEAKASMWLAQPAELTAERDGRVDFRSDLGVGTAPQFTGSAAYRIRPRHEVRIDYTSFRNSGISVVESPVVFQNTTFAQGATVSGHMNLDMVAPGYQWNFICRKRGYAGIRTGLEVIHADIGLSGQASFYEPHTVTTRPVALRDSVTALLPVVGPAFEWMVPGTTRVNLNGCVKGMKLSGYDSYIDARLNAGLALSRNFRVEAGYAFVQDARVEAAAERLGVGFRNRGLLAGLAARW